MPKSRTWEEECLPRLQVIDSSKPIAVCVLWDLLEKLPDYAPELAQARGISVIGNLRTPIGIGWFLRGLWKFPAIRRVVVWGSDLPPHTGEALMRLWREGPTDEHRVPEFGWKIDPLVPLEAIDALRKNVELVDLRHERKAAAILAHLDGPNGVIREARDFPPVLIPERKTLVSEPATIFIRGRDPGDAWQRIIHYILQYGQPRDTRKKESIIHCFDVHVVFPVPKEDDPERWFGISRKDVEGYVKEVLRPTPPTATDSSGREVSTVDYHYGQRIQNWLGHNQLEEVISRLKENPETKRASISILQTPDLETLEDAPCWSLITFAVIDGKLASSHVFRSHDMFGGWPNNVLAILRIHRLAAERLGVGLGWIEVISQNAQIYTRHFATAEEWLSKRGFTIAKASHVIGFRSDPAGSFVFTILPDRKVRAQLMSPTGDEVLWEAEHANPSVLIRWIVESMVLEPQHIRFLGAEEEKLNRSLKTGEPYHQG